MGNYKLSDEAQDDLVGIHQYGVRKWGKRRLHPIDISIEFSGFAFGVHVHELAGESRTSSF